MTLEDEEPLLSRTLFAIWEALLVILLSFSAVNDECSSVYSVLTRATFGWLLDAGSGFLKSYACKSLTR